MSTARKQAFNNYSMSSQSRSKAYGKINILWNQMRPDLHFEDKETIRVQRLEWIADFLGLKKLVSTTTLSDAQIGRVLDEMMRLTGQTPKTPQTAPKSQPSGIVGVVESTATGGAEVIHLATPEQVYTLEKIETHIGWTQEQRENYLKPRFRRTNFRTLKFEQANALMMQMLNIAAHKDLRLILGPGKPISREATRKYIPTLKRKLQIDR